jgi:glycosyltransferase involved in cell wall biosynthesis
MTEHLRSRLKGLGLSPHAIEFPGPADRTALPAVYAGAAVVVIPSLWENFPYTGLEAMAAGRAVGASAVGGIPEIITHEADGLLVPAGSPEALTVIERFAPEPVCGATLRAYESVL